MVGEITDRNFENLADLPNSPIISLLLSNVRRDSLPANDEGTNNNWISIFNKLFSFAQAHAFTLEIELEELERGDLSALCGTVIQILALISIFNPLKWEKAYAAVDHESRKVIDSTVLAVAQELKAQRSSAGDIKRVLERLEREEERRLKAEEQILQLEEQLTAVKAELQGANRTIAQKMEEVNEVKRSRANTLRQFEDLLYSSNPLGADDQKAIEKLNSEKESLTDKLIKSEQIIYEKTNEAEKLRVLLSVSEGKRREAEGMQETCDKLLRANEELKAERDVRESKLQLLEIGEKTILRYQERLKEETQRNFDLKLRVSELESKVKSLETKIASDGENLALLKSSSVADRDHPSFSTSLDDENNQLKEKVRQLTIELGKMNIAVLEREEKENNHKMHAIKLKTLSLENNMLVAKNKRLELASKVGTFNCLDLPFSADQAPRISIRTQNETNAEDVARVKAACEEKLDVVYSAVVMYAQNLMYSQSRFFAPNQEERKRDVLKQFTLNNILKTSIN